jgi:spermidine/putrescine ABC transporter ATP-binding subunit
MSNIEINALTKRFGSIVALQDVSLSLGDGEFFGLLGPSGSGKTTLLRCIAGFMEPDSGRVVFDGINMRSVPAHRRNVGMVFQNYALFPHMSVSENIAFALSVRHRARKEIIEKVSAMLKLVQLTGYEARRPHQLSGGQQQRVALARALVSNPRILLLDEPLGALDKRLRQQMQTELKQIQQKVGITTIFVTHDQEEALTLCDRMAIFDRGQIVQVGAPNLVYERPRTSFAAEFLGAANFVHGRSRGLNRGRGAISLAGGGDIFTEDPLPEAGAEATLVVRPEKLVISEANRSSEIPASLVNRLTGKIDKIAYLGSSIVYTVDAAPGHFTVFQQNRDTPPFKLGELVLLSWASEHSVVILS